MKITVSVHGRFHAFELAKGLNAQGFLKELWTTYPKFAVRKLIGDLTVIRSMPELEAVRRLAGMFGNNQAVDLLVSRNFAKRLAKHSFRETDILVGWSSATLEAIKPARQQGARVILERGSSHIVHQTEVLKSVYAKAGQVFNGTSSELIDRECAEYELADTICVPSHFAAKTFAQQGVPEEKIRINPYGVDLTGFSPTDRRNRPRPLKILFVGRVGYRKGVPLLLEAFRKIRADAQLHLVGPVESDFKSELQRLARERVVVHGPQPALNLPGFYASADVFCLPSYEEGFPLVVLQAMASGLPVVVSRETGAGDIIKSDINGHILDELDQENIIAALSTLLADQELRLSWGESARATVQDGFGWNDYVERAIGIYRNLPVLKN